MNTNPLTPSAYEPPAPPVAASNPAALVALILGIVAAAGALVPVVNVLALLVGLGALVVAIVALVKVRRVHVGRRMAVAGLVLALASFVLVPTVNAILFHAWDTTPTITEPTPDPLPSSSATSAPEEPEPTNGGPGTDTEPADEQPAAEEQFDGVGTFGDTAQYDVVDVMITAPAPFTPEPEAAGADLFTESVAFDITITNTGTEPFDPSMAFLTGSSAGVEASEVFDMANGVGGAPMTQVLPGKSVTYRAALNVADPNDVVVQFAPSWDHEAVLFTD